MMISGTLKLHQVNAGGGAVKITPVLVRSLTISTFKSWLLKGDKGTH